MPGALIRTSTFVIAVAVALGLPVLGGSERPPVTVEAASGPIVSPPAAVAAADPPTRRAPLPLAAPRPEPAASLSNAPVRVSSAPAPLAEPYAPFTAPPARVVSNRATAARLSPPFPQSRAPAAAPALPLPRPATSVGPIQSVSELARYYGDPPDAALGRFRIPLLGVDAPLGTRQVGADGSIPASTGPADVVWYDFSGWDALGGEIGGGRNAVFSGHVDYGGFVSYAGVQFRGAAVFRDLEQLLPGDLIHVDIDGRTLTYVVQWLRQVSASSGDWGAMLSGDVETDSITLITCGGDFDDTSRSYSDRVVVRATRR